LQKSKIKNKPNLVEILLVCKYVIEKLPKKENQALRPDFKKTKK
jgi:hypothetical protein